MAELETKTTASKNKHGKKLIKKSTRVDLTPMVDLGFLLLTFFVFTAVLAKPKVMDIVSPIESDKTTDICENCVLTAMLTKADKIIYYEGMPESNPVLKETSFTVEGIRVVLLQKKAAVKKIKGTSDKMVLIVKPADESSYKNFVDILDEVAITGVKHYFIDEINATDKKLLTKN
ncbi:ExbD/TolR family protein [Ferruginibacter sp.]|nr:biopolymer transporter ExbD [Ferruginibacter sp.]